MPTARDILAVLEKLAGEREKTASGAVGSGNYISVNEKYGMQGLPYCGTTIRYAHEAAGCNLLKACSNPAYVPTIMAYCKAKGWQVNKPVPGCIFAYKDDHVGTVYEVSGNTIITLEGNSTVRETYADAKNGTGAFFEGIGWKKRIYDGNYTFYLPNYDGISSSSSGSTATAATGAASAPASKTARKTPCTVSAYILRYGNEGEAVITLQAALKARGFDCGAADGEFGTKTLNAVKAYQKKNGLEDDGEVGALTWAKLHKL